MIQVWPLIKKKSQKNDLLVSTLGPGLSEKPFIGPDWRVAKQTAERCGTVLQACSCLSNCTSRAMHGLCLKIRKTEFSKGGSQKSWGREERQRHREGRKRGRRTTKQKGSHFSCVWGWSFFREGAWHTLWSSYWCHHCWSGPSFLCGGPCHYSYQDDWFHRNEHILVFHFVPLLAIASFYITSGKPATLTSALLPIIQT